MRGFADTAYVHAKACGLRSRLLSRSDYQTLLSGFALDRFFPGLPSSPGPADCTAIKEELFRRSIRGVLVLAEALEAYRGLFMAFLRLFEARNVKWLLARSLGAAQTDGQWYEIGPYGVFCRGDLDTLQDWETLQRRLRKTYLWRLCAGAGQPRFETLEGMLDLQCLGSFLSAAQRLNAPDLLIVQECILMRCTLLKVLWAWRLERYYGWERAQARDHVGTAIREQGRIDENLRRGRPRLFELRLRGACETEAYPAEQAGRGEPLFEQHAESMFYGYVRSLARGDFHAIACVVGYLWLLYFEIRNLFLLLDGIRFGLPAETLNTMLICEA
jgi:vacuolar-type H+-ATPase subunit C/Vma6